MWLSCNKWIPLPKKEYIFLLLWWSGLQIKHESKKDLRVVDSPQNILQEWGSSD